MPVDEPLPPTPISSLAEAREPTPVGEGEILSIAALLGEPVGYIDEKDGAVVQHVFPLASEANSSSNESSAAGLDFHTELSFSRRHPEWPMDYACPDFLLIFCLRPDPMYQANTSILEARTICQRLPEQHLRALREPNFELRAPVFFHAQGETVRDRGAIESLSYQGPIGHLESHSTSLAVSGALVPRQTKRSMRYEKWHARRRNFICPARSRRCARAQQPNLCARQRPLRSTL